MRINHLAATIVALSFVLTASCVQSPNSSPTEETTTNGEPTGEAQESLPIVSYKPKDFPFVIVIPDDKKDEAGGWQEAKATLDFRQWVIPHPSRQWECRLTIGMPLRAKDVGVITPIRAATLSVQVAEDIARAMDYELPAGIFCIKFVEGANGLFSSRYPKLGARVTK